MKKTLMLILTAALIFLLFSCQNKESAPPSAVPSGRVVQVVPVTLSVESIPFQGETKSQIQSSAEQIQQAMLFAMDAQDGRILLKQNGDGSTSPIVATVEASAISSFDWGLPMGTCTVYAIANYSDELKQILNNYANDKTLTVETLNSITYSNNTTSFLTTVPSKGLPMAGVSDITVNSSGQAISYPVKKLFARYDIFFDTSAYTEAGYTVTATAIEGLSSPSSAYWFREGVLPEGIQFVNLDSATQADLTAVSSSGCTLYLLENCQGNKEGFQHWWDVQFAPASTLDGLTNLLVKTTYTDHNGLCRKSTCHIYLGSDCKSNFDVRRGVATTLNLRLRPGICKEIYLGTGNTITSGPFETISVPFETTLPEKGLLSFASNPDITLESFTFGAKSGGDHPECGYGGIVTYVANSQARAATYSLLSVKGEASADIGDEVRVYFPYSFRFSWENGAAPDHVAQRNLLHCIDNYTGTDSAAGVFTVREAGNVRLVNNNDGTAWVSLTGPFPLSDALSIAAANGEGHVDVPLEGRLPHFGCTVPGTAYADAPSSMTFSYYQADASGNKTDSPMTVLPAAASPTASGSILNRELVEELIPPYANSSGGRLGFSTRFSADGSCTVEAWLKTYSGIASLIVPSGAAFQADQVQIGITGHTADRGLFEAPFNVWNPWKNLSAPAQAGVMDDYTLYCEPGASQNGLAGVGWSPAQTRPAGGDPDNLTLSIQNPVLASLGNTSLHARFADGTGELESLCSGTPGKTAADAPVSASSTWELTMGLKGRTAAETGTHNAGKLEVILQLANAYDHTVLEKTVAEAFIRLHLYIWPSVSGPDLVNGNGGAPQYKQFRIAPLCHTWGKEIPVLDSFFQNPVLEASSQVHTRGIGACTLQEPVSQLGVIARSPGNQSHAASYLTPNSYTIPSKEDLRRCFVIASSPFSFRAAGNGTRNDETFFGLDHFLGNGNYTLPDEYTLTYDPSGNKQTYSYGNTSPAQLFVFHIGNASPGGDFPGFFFSPENGF